MIPNAIAEKLKRQSKDDFKGRHLEAWLGHRKVNALRPKLAPAAFAHAACKRAISFHICVAAALSSRL